MSSRKLEESGKVEAVRRAHAEYFLALAEEAEPMLWGADDATWLDRLKQDHDNMRAALSWAIEQEEATLALRVGGALRWFWYMEGYYGEGRRWLEAALGKNWGAAAAEARARTLEGVGWLASSQGDLERAQAAANEGLKLSTEAGLGKVIVADFQNVLGTPHGTGVTTSGRRSCLRRAWRSTGQSRTLEALRCPSAIWPTWRAIAVTMSWRRNYTRKAWPWRKTWAVLSCSAHT